jgi:hypothetical protein
MKHQLSGILTNAHRVSIQATVDEILAEGGSQKGLQLMKVTQVPAAILEHEVISGFGGKTQERAMGSQGKQVAGVSSKTKIFKPGSYQEFHRFNETEILKLRKFGTLGDRGVTGMTDGELSFTGMVGKKLQVRLQNRLQQLAWDAIFTGKFVYEGIEFDFGIPAANLITAATDWSDTANADVLADLDNLLWNTDVTRKYIIEEIIFNPKTGGDIRRAIMKKYGVNNSNILNATVTELGRYFLPNLPALNPCLDSYQDETVDANGVVTAGAAQYFVPNDKLLIVPKLAGTMYPQYGEIEIVENINAPGATLDRPDVGIYTFIDEKGLEEKKSPYVDVVAGFNGGANLKRPNDVIILSV